MLSRVLFSWSAFTDNPGWTLCDEDDVRTSWKKKKKEKEMKKEMKKKEEGIKKEGRERRRR
jgi:hypothetical protein